MCNSYSIERSKDGIDFEEIALVEGQGNTIDMTNYTTIDKSPMIDENLYRLNQYDLDSTHAHLGKIISIPYIPKSNFTIYPNPNHADMVSIVSSEAHEPKVYAEIYNITGKLVQSMNCEVTDGTNYKEFSLNNMQSGLYYIIIHSGPTINKIREALAKGIESNLVQAITILRSSNASFFLSS